MVGLVKQYLHKAIGKVTFTKQELKEVLVDTEMNSLQFSVFTPNILIHKEPNTTTEEQFEDNDIVIIKSCNDISIDLRT